MVSDPSDMAADAERRALEAAEPQTAEPQTPDQSDLHQDPKHDPQQGAAPASLVAIGASAGGLDALERFFDCAPCDSDAAFVVIQHLSPDHKSMMASLLARHTQMPVVAVYEGMELCANRVHLIPPGVIMRVEGRVLRLTPKAPRVLSLPIDAFFNSAADEWGERIIGVILSGTGTDGTRGAGAINEAGGLLAAQEPSSARFDGMPVSVIATGFVDYVNAAEEIGEWVGQVLLLDPALRRAGVAQLETTPALHEPLSDILRHVSDACGINFADYKIGTLQRRVERRMIVRQCPEFSAYLRLIRSDPSELDALYREMLISVTRFFRDTDAFAALAQPMEDLVRAAHAQRRALRIWSAGTSTGEEAYSLAIIALEACDRVGLWPGVKVFATDVKQSNIDAGSVGIYPESIVAEIAPELLERYFSARDGRFLVKPELRQAMVFARHNLLTDPPFTQIDLVSCRNILIYFKLGAQERALKRLQYALRAQGVLFLGRSEMGSAIETDFHPLHRQQKIWRLMDTAARPMLTDRPLRGGGAEVSDLGGRERFLARARPASSAVELGAQSLTQAYAPPPAVLVNSHDEIVHSYGDVAQYLSLRGGAPSLELSRLLPDVLVPIAKAVLFSARRDGVAVVSNVVALGQGEKGPRMLRLAVRPVGGAEDGGLRLVIFEAQDVAASGLAPDLLAQVDIGTETRARLEMLEQELTATRESLRIIIEEMEASSEELQATNEEMMASNEELQSTNEELQSVNEELSTVNAEYQEKIDILNRMNADLENLTQLVPTGTIFVDAGLNVTRFSADASEVFRLRAGDIGRPIADLAHRLEFPDLIDVLAHGLETFTPDEREVSSLDGRQYLIRVLPYRLANVDQRALVLTFVDVTLSRSARKMQAIIDALGETVAVLGHDGEIRMVNGAWERFARANGAEPAAFGPGANYFGACRGPALSGDDALTAQAAEAGLRSVLSGERETFSLEYPCDGPDARRWFLLYARALPKEFGGAVVSHFDVSAWKYPQERAAAMDAAQ